MPQPYEIEDIALALEHLKNQRSGTPISSAFFSGGPAWITLLVLVVGAFMALNTRLSTVEYKADISIADRADLHHRLDKNDDALTSLRTDLAEIKTTLKQLVDQRDYTTTSTSSYSPARRH